MLSYKLVDTGVYFRAGKGAMFLSDRVASLSVVTYSKQDYNFRNQFGMNDGIIFLNCKLLSSKLLRTMYE